MKSTLRSISLVLTACVLLIGFTISLSSFGRGSSIKLNSTLDTGNDTGTGTDTGEEKTYWDDDDGPCTFQEWVSKPGGGMELKDFPGVQNPCKKVKTQASCTSYDCKKVTPDN